MTTTTDDLESLFEVQPLTDLRITQRGEKLEAAAFRRRNARRACGIAAATIASLGLALGAMMTLSPMTSGSDFPIAQPTATQTAAPEAAPEAGPAAPAAIEAVAQVSPVAEQPVAEAAPVDVPEAPYSDEDHSSHDHGSEYSSTSTSGDNSGGSSGSSSNSAPKQQSAPSMRDHAQSVVNKYVSGVTVQVGSPCNAGSVHGTASFDGIITICDGPGWDSSIGHSVLVHEAAHHIIFQSHKPGAGSGSFEAECFTDLIAERLGDGHGGYCASGWTAAEHALADEILGW